MQRAAHPVAERRPTGAAVQEAQRSVRGKLMRIVAFTTAIALLAAGIAMLTHDLSAYRASWATDLETQANILATSTGPALAFDDHSVAQRTLAMLQGRPALLVAALYGADGNLYASYVRPGRQPPPERLQLLATRKPILGPDMQLVHPIYEHGERVGTILLQSHHDIWARVQAYLSIFAMVMVMSLLVALALSRALQKGITQPLDAMADVARQVVNQRDYSLRARKTTNDEIGVVVDAFNSMLDEVQVRARALEQSNTALHAEVQTRQDAESALESANARLENTMAALREADRRKDEFLATLAHELRNPLAPIMHAVKLMEAPGSVETQRQWGREVIARQVQRMALLLDDLLDVSRITRGRLELRKDYVDLRSLVVSAVETARPLIDAKRHTLQIELPPRPVELEVDPLRVSQALSNLLTNAAKYTDEEGHIAVRVAVETGGLLIEVTDDGIGLEAGVIPRLFEMFSQIDSANHRAEGGLGIGLALVKGLVALHGGSVEAQSAGLGWGSRFTIRLPVSVIAEARQEIARLPAAQETAAAPRCKVLVADDNRDGADSLKLLLQLEGYETFVAYNGHEALQLGAREHPRVVILDVGMPDMTGYEAARTIRQQAWGRRALLIAVTGWGQRDDKEKARAAGFDEHFTKPVAAERLQASLTAFLRRAGHELRETDGTAHGFAAV